MLQMRNSPILWAIPLLFAVCFLSIPAGAKYAGGSGTAQDPYQLATAADLILLGETPADYDKHFILTANIDLDPNLPGRKVFDKAVIAPHVRDTNWVLRGTAFTGVFDGKGHTVSHLTIQGGSYLGLFGQLESGAEVKSLGVVDTGVVDGLYYVGGLVGANSGTVTRCYSSGEVSGGWYVGGLVGDNYNGSVTQCYSTGAVRGTKYVGGLVGSNPGTVTHCYSTGAVSGNFLAGGLVGCNVECYDEGRWPCYSGTVTSCFWDIQTSGQAASAGGMGKTTAEMRMQGTFTDAGWDFVGETANGTEDIWWINEGKDYPRLWWECDAPERLPVVELDAANFDAQIAEGVILVDFYATWCPHCATQAPILEEVADRIQGRARVVKLDIDKARAIAQRYGVTAIPTLIVFQEGQPVKRFVGVTQADTLVTALLSAVDSLGQQSP